MGRLPESWRDTEEERGERKREEERKRESGSLLAKEQQSVCVREKESRAPICLAASQVVEQRMGTISMCAAA